MNSQHTTLPTVEQFPRWLGGRRYLLVSLTVVVVMLLGGVTGVHADMRGETVCGIPPTEPVLVVFSGPGRGRGDEALGMRSIRMRLVPGCSGCHRGRVRMQRQGGAVDGRGF